MRGERFEVVEVGADTPSDALAAGVLTCSERRLVAIVLTITTEVRASVVRSAIDAIRATADQAAGIANIHRQSQRTDFGKRTFLRRVSFNRYAGRGWALHVAKLQYRITRVHYVHWPT